MVVLPYSGKFKITTLFGKPGSWACGWHIGVDFVGSDNKNVLAVNDGKVTKITLTGSYGRCIRILQNDGYLALYAHLSSIAVKMGDTVKAGQKIGVEGSTGNSTGSHLHLEIHSGSYNYPAKGSSPATAAWLNNPCTYLGIENKLGEVSDMATVTKTALILNGKEKKFDAIVQDGVTYTALRPVLQELGYSVNYDGDTKKTTVV